MNIYSTRHGQTDFNKDELILGTTDIELNEKGLQQAGELADKISEMNCIDIITREEKKRRAGAPQGIRRSRAYPRVRGCRD